MCGICGIVYDDLGRPVDKAILERMNASLAHRGPDSDGFYVSGNAGLAMRRLAIIDLATGDQPMSNEDGSIWVIQNGEIYNYQELRRELEGQGHEFRTASDTEVLVHLYEQAGVDFARRLRGMFAIAIWDFSRQRLVLARDRAGQKPLYYTQTDGGMLFGSEIRSLLEYPGFSPDIDPRAVHHFLSFQYVPGPGTIFKEIREVPPAHTLTLQDGNITLERYWDLDFRNKLTLSQTESREGLRDKLREAVRLRLISDVSLGAHLSGGVDSSIVVALMTEMSDRPVKTFSIGFDEASFDETSYARQIADLFSTDHREFVVRPEAEDTVFGLVRHVDQPLADPAVLPLWHLSRLTRQHVTVALNGDGGDEAFAGYQRYRIDPIIDWYRMAPRSLRVRMIEPMLALLPSNASKRFEHSTVMALRQLNKAAYLGHDASKLRWSSYFDESEKRCLYSNSFRDTIGDEDTPELLAAIFETALADNRIDRTLYTDFHSYLPGALLAKADRMSMAHSLEARSPFLDHEVMEFAARLPPRFKVGPIGSKRILRRAFSDVIPNEVLNRRKAGFSVPLGRWFKIDLRDLAYDSLLGSGAQTRDYFRSEMVENILEEHVSGAEDHGKRLWALMVLELWMRCASDSNAQNDIRGSNTIVEPSA